MKNSVLSTYFKALLEAYKLYNKRKDKKDKKTNDEVARIVETASGLNNANKNIEQKGTLTDSAKERAKRIWSEKQQKRELESAKRKTMNKSFYELKRPVKRFKRKNNESRNKIIKQEKIDEKSFDELMKM
ncbi:hypothetical protein MHBO_000581 [Bonamia ostreae]|uniref:Uncharacterized protein n=1 Tax=Bonamia ostreae TaxID=126728 RepID=A0ABV2AG42_9EUKA